MKGLLKKAIGLAIAGSMIFGILPTSGFAENKDATITKNSLHGYYLDNTTSLTEPSTNLIAKSASNRYAIYEFDLPNVTADAVKSIKVNVTPVYLGSINTDYIHLYAINIPDNATRDAATVKTLVDNARADAYEFYNAKNNTTYNVSNANNAKIGIEAGIDPDNKTTLYVPKVDWAPTNPDSSGKGNIVGKTGEFDITEYIKGYAYDETTNARKYSKIAVVMNSYNDVRFAPSATINTVIDKNVYLDKLKAAKTGKALNSIISGLTSEECEILGIDTTAYKALTFPRYAAEQIIIDGFNTLTDFISCLQSDVSKVSNASQSDYNIQFTNNIDDDATEISTDLSSITVDFGTDLAPGCWNNTNVTLEKASDGTVVSISLNNDFVVTINEQLRKATEYILTIKNLKDDSNNDLVNRRIYFKTAFYFDKLEFDTKDALRIGEEIDLNVYGIYDENRVDANADITVSDTNVVSYSNGKLTGLAYGYAVITATVENGRGGDVVAKKIVVVSPAQKKYDFEENGNSADSHTGNGAYATIGNEETIFESNYETFAVSVWFKDNMSIIAANSFGIKNATISIQNNDYVAGAGSMSRSAGWHNAVFVCDETKTTVFINGIKIDEIQSVDAEFIADADKMQLY